MKELDFLPDWYRADRNRKHRRRRHCILFGIITALVAGWSFIAGRSVSGLQAETRQMEASLQQKQQTVQTAMEMQQQIEQLKGQADVLQTLTPRTAISAVLGELSAQACDNIILGRVTLTLEPIAEAAAPAEESPGVVRLGAAKTAVSSPLPKALQRTRLTLTGIAVGAADVARLIENLETSHYFENVSPGFSRAKKINNREVTEFEIACTVADYKVQK